MLQDQLNISAITIFKKLFLSIKKRKKNLDFILFKNQINKVILDLLLLGTTLSFNKIIILTKRIMIVDNLTIINFQSHFYQGSNKNLKSSIFILHESRIIRLIMNKSNFNHTQILIILFKILISKLIIILNKNLLTKKRNKQKMHQLQIKLLVIIVKQQNSIALLL